MKAELHAVPSSAEEWAARIGLKDLSTDERAAFARWLAIDSSHRSEFEEVMLVESMSAGVTPESVADLLAEVEPGRRQRTAWVMMGSVAAGIVAVAIAFTFAFAPHDDLQRAATRHGEQRSLILPDGSVVQLNTDSQIGYRVDGDKRQVALPRGEAFFDVAEDSSRPFVVTTPAAEVRVLGTQFSVRTRDDGVEVLVKKGRVEVIPLKAAVPLPLRAFSAGEHLTLTQGQQVKVEPASASTKTQIVLVDAERATAWRIGILDIDGMTLEDVIAEVNRYAPVPFVVDDPSIRALRLSGRFRVADTESIRFMLRERLDVESQVDGERIVLRAGSRESVN